MYSRGVKTVNIVYRAGRENANADALCRCPQLPGPTEGVAEAEVQVAVVRERETPTDLEQLNSKQLLTSEPSPELLPCSDDFGIQQRKDPQVEEMYRYLQEGELPCDEKRAPKVTRQKMPTNTAEVAPSVQR